MTRVEVVAPGPLTTIQDLGRPGFAHIGVPRSGAADRPALILANRLVGNHAGAAALETTLTGPRLRFHDRALVALAGAPVRGAVMYDAFQVEAGEELRVGTAVRRLRTYIAFAGGLRVPLTLGSAATDTLTGLGPAPLRAGDVLELGFGGAKYMPEHVFGPSEPGTALRVVPGPRADWFTPAALTLLTSAEFTASHEASRVGVRLDGPALARAREGELRSEGLVPGAIQVPPDGRPILLLSDHPTTGGYPVIAVLHSDDIPLAAQLRPGTRVRFRAVP